MLLLSPNIWYWGVAMKPKGSRQYQNIEISTYLVPNILVLPRPFWSKMPFLVNIFILALPFEVERAFRHIFLVLTPIFYTLGAKSYAKRYLLQSLYLLGFNILFVTPSFRPKAFASLYFPHFDTFHRSIR